MELALIFVIIIVIILIAWMSGMFTHNTHLMQSLSGFWEADSSFCEEADLDMFCIYFDGTTKEKACYILASSKDKMILNEATTAKFSKKLAWSTDWSKPQYFTVTFGKIDRSDDIFPEVQDLCYFPNCNKLVFKYQDTITAVLYKNPVNTELEQIIKQESK